MFAKIAYAFLTALVLGTSVLATQASAGPAPLGIGSNYFDRASASGFGGR